MNKKKFAILMFVFCFAFLAGRGTAIITMEVVTMIADDNKSNASWGLSFQKDGETPVGNETKEELKKNNAYFVGDEGKKVIYLTFDAGYENGNMPAILDALKKHNVRAAFFVVGNFMENNRDLLNRMVSEGHIIGNHSYSHPDMTSLGDDKFTMELKKNEELYKEITGQEMPKVYRPPQGKYNGYSFDMANKMGYKTFFWSLAYVDWYDDKQPSKEEAFDKLLKRIHPGAIVLLHSTSKTNGEILDELLSKWEEMGYTFGVITDIGMEDISKNNS